MNEGNAEIRTTEEQVATEPKKTVDKNFIKKLIKPAIAVLVSLVLLIMAFCPIIKYEQIKVTVDGDDPDDAEVIVYEETLGISAVKYIGLFFDTLKSEKVDDLIDSDMGDEWVDLEEEALELAMKIDYDDEDEVEELAELERDYLYLTYRMALQSKDVSVSVVDMLTLVFAIALILAAIALFVFAVLDLLRAVLGGIIPEKLCGKTKLMTALVCLIPGLMLVLYILMLLGKSINDVAIQGGAYYPVSMAGSAVFALIVSVAAIVATLVLRVINKEIVIDKVVRRRIISAALAFIVICAAGSSIFTMKFDGDTTFSEKNVKAGVKGDMFALSANYEDVSDFFDDIFGFGGGISSGVSRYGIVDEEAEVYATPALLSEYYDEDTTSFSIIYMTVIILITLGAASIFVVDACNITVGACEKYRSIAVRIIAHIIAFIIMTFLFIFSMAFKEVFENNTDELLSVSFSLGSFLMYLGTIFWIAYRPRRKKRIDVLEAELAKTQAELAKTQAEVAQTQEQ